MKLSDYAKKNSITYRTAYRHWKSGIIKGYTLPTGTIVIEDDTITKYRDYVVYCRVSSQDQKDDLERQKHRLENFCSAKGYVVRDTICEIASGLNDNRPKLNKILSSESNVVVEHKDRLTRFGFNYIKLLLNKEGRDIIVINESENKDDLVQDFISIITSFCARIYGRRRSKRKTEVITKELTRDYEDTKKQ